MQEEFKERFVSLYNKFKKNFYRHVFKTMEDGDLNLTPLEVFTLEVIYLIGKPTVNELARFLEASPPNTAYKVTSLVNKGYIERVQSQEDKREYHLVLTPKFDAYYYDKNKDILKNLEKLGQTLDETSLRILIDAIEKMESVSFPES